MRRRLLLVWRGAVSLLSPETLAAPQIRVELQWDRLAPTLHVLPGSEGRREMEAPPILQQENGLRVLSLL